MRIPEEQNLRQIRFVAKLLDGEYGYPPAGWTEIHGETGKSALIWSLVKWRMDRNARPTLILPIVENYDYLASARWAGVDKRLVHVIQRPENLLKLTLNMVKADFFGQVIAEGLGFMLGPGKLIEQAERLLGGLHLMQELAYEARLRDVALYATSYSVSAGRGYLSEYSLGGRAMLQVATERRIFLTQTGYHLAGGRRVGEYYHAENLLDTTRRHGRFEILYGAGKGPIRLRTPEPEQGDLDIVYENVVYEDT